MSSVFIFDVIGVGMTTRKFVLRPVAPGECCLWIMWWAANTIQLITFNSTIIIRTLKLHLLWCPPRPGLGLGDAPNGDDG